MRLAEHPVGVVGGGPAGLATALALHAHGVDVCVIEQADWSAARAGEHLAAAALPVLARLGLQGLYDRGLPCRGVDSAWGSLKPQFHDLQLFTPLGGGRIVERPRFDQAMLAHAVARGIRCLERTRVLRATYEGTRGTWRVMLRSSSSQLQEETFSCMVDASGRAASLARARGARVVAYDRLVGVSARAAVPLPVAPAVAHKLRIWSVRDGWWYLATLPGGEQVATWMTDVQRVGQVAQREHWQQHCTRHFQAAQAQLRLPSQLAAATWERPRSFPAHSQRLVRPYGDGWIAAGDAAMAFDPLSSSGLSKALLGGCDAADTVARHMAGDPGACTRYAERLRRDWLRYLEARCENYRLEQRFPDAEFWRERQHEPTLRHTIELDPRRTLRRAPGACAASASEVLAHRMPEVNGAALFERVAGGRLAADVVRDVVGCQELDDHSAIVALQLLIEHGILLSAPA